MRVQHKNHFTPLHLALSYERFDIARVLLKNGATANSKDNFGRTPLHLVAKGKYNFEQDRIGIAQLLLERGADVHAHDNDNVTPLHLACYDWRVAIARVLLDGGAAPNSKGNLGRIPLHSVAAGGYLYSKDDGIRVAQLLLERGTDVDALDEDNTTPLYLASFYGKVELVRVLLDSGATTNSKGTQGRTALHAVAEGDCYSRDDGVLVAKALLESGADVNTLDSDNETPLHLASYLRKAEMILALLTAGANASARNAQGRTPLHLVAQGPYFSEGHGVGVAQLLLEYGVDVNAQDRNHATPSDLASYYEMKEIGSLLLHYGGKINAKIDRATQLQLGLDGE